MQMREAPSKPSFFVPGQSNIGLHTRSHLPRIEIPSNLETSVLPVIRPERRVPGNLGECDRAIYHHALDGAAAQTSKFDWYSIFGSFRDCLPEAIDEHAKSHNRGSVMDVVVIGAGPAGLSAALRAAELGARTVLVTRNEFGGMA